MTYIEEGEPVGIRSEVIELVSVNSKVFSISVSKSSRMRDSRGKYSRGASH
jgi:hypothetical protein